MARVEFFSLSPQEQRELLKRFFIAITGLNNLKGGESFFRDLLHPQEITMFARRLKAAEMLIAGESFQEIERRMRISPTTIAKIHRWVNSERGGYRAAVKQLKKVDKQNLRKAIKESKSMGYGWEHIKKVYPTVDAETIHEIFETIESYKRKRTRKKSIRK